MSNMSETSLDRIEKLLSGSIKTLTVGQLSQDEIEGAIQLISVHNDVKQKDFYALNLARHIAATGDLNDLQKAIQLVLDVKSDPYSRCFTIINLYERLWIIEDQDGILQLASVMENDASIMEQDN